MSFAVSNPSEISRERLAPYTSAPMDKYSSLIEHYGYLIVFFGVMLGNSGIPFPSAAILLTAGIMVQQGHLEFGDAIVFGILGVIIGSQIGYWVGYKGGRPFVLKWGRYVKLIAARRPGGLLASGREQRRTR